MKPLDRIVFVIGIVLLFGGLDIAILLSHMSRWVGIGFILAGIGILLIAVKRIETIIPQKTEKSDNLASRIIHLLTFNGRFRESIPIAGIGVLISVISFNLFLSDKFVLGSNDYVGILLAGILISYYWIPKKYSVERDFALLFSIFLFVFLVIPTTMLEFTSQAEDTNSIFTYYLLALPTTFLARILGIDAISPGTHHMLGIPMYNYIDMTGPGGAQISLEIGLSCSGLYSVAIFVSAFIAFVAVEYKKFDRNVGLLLGIGIFLAWIANILRMTIIIIVGHYYGYRTMQWTHNNIGELIFMAWVILFWLFMFRYFGVLDSKEAMSTKQKEAKGKCAICGEPLSPSLPSKRCECGAISHAGCILTNENRCPACGVEFPQESKAI